MSFIVDELKEARTHKKGFVEQINRITPWNELTELVEPHYYEEGRPGNQPYSLRLMLRIYVLQNCYDLADDAMRDEVIDSRAFSDFCEVQSSNQVPDGDTIGRFRNILIKNGIQEQFFALIVKKLTEEKLILKKGTIVDSTFIDAPSSTKNKEKKRDPDGKSGKKGTTWHFGYKAHVGVDKDTGVVHTVEVTGANESDVNMTPKLLHGEEEGLWGDAAYVGAEKREDMPKTNKNGKRIRYHINRKKSSYKDNSKRSQGQIKRREREKSSVRCKVEHVFGLVKKKLRYRKTRYRGIEKQRAKLNMMFALANLIIADWRRAVAA